MLLKINSVLSAQELIDDRAFLTDAPFDDGKPSARLSTRQVKYNQELALTERKLQSLNNLVMGRLMHHSEFRNVAFIKQVASRTNCRGLLDPEHSARLRR